MGRPLRMYEADAYYFVTARCFQSRLLLRPSPSIVEVLGGVLAKAAEKYEVDLCGFVAASNHVHLLCRARDGQLSDFMKYFLCNVSKKVGRLIDWRGQLWERRFVAEKVLDDDALEGRLRYILSHGVKEGLVREAAEWPGLSSLTQLLGDPKRTFLHYSWSKRWENGKLLEGAEDCWAPELATEVVLQVHPLKHWEGWSVEQRQARVRQMVRDIEQEWRPQHASVLGVDKVLAQQPHTRPEKTKRTPSPRVHTTVPALRIEFFAMYDAFVSAFRLGVEKLRATKLPEFPNFAFAPFIAVRV